MNTQTQTQTEPRFSPTGSVAKALAKGLPTRMLNRLEENGARAKPFGASSSRGKNYRDHIAFLRTMTRGILIHEEEHGKGKNRTHWFLTLTPNAEGTEFFVTRLVVEYRDPRKRNEEGVGVTFTQHVVERVFQRFTKNPELALVLLGSATLIMEEGYTPGKFELGVMAGIFIIEVYGRPGAARAKVITFIDADKLRPEQSAMLGDARKIS